jgi:NCS1 family nucleobase:cation symporter-1
LMLSSVFVPLFGVVISQLAAGGRAADRRLNLLPVLIWLIGIAVFHLCPLALPQLGAALPSLCVTLIFGAAYRKWRS